MRLFIYVMWNCFLVALGTTWAIDAYVEGHKGIALIFMTCALFNLTLFLLRKDNI